MPLTGENRDPERASIDQSFTLLQAEITYLIRQRDALRAAAQAVMADRMSFRNKFPDRTFPPLEPEYEALRAAIEEAKSV